MIATHIFASVFCGIGEEGWRVEKAHLIADPTSEVDIYITSIYYIFLTFTTVGYGQITPSTEDEYLYSLLIELVGIVFFVYFMGNVYSILDDTRTLESIRQHEQDGLEFWMLKLGKVRT